MTTDRATATYPRTGTMSAEGHGIEIFHPVLGWAPVTMVNGSELCLSFSDHHAWFRLDDGVVSGWTIRNAAGLMQWMRRVAA
jgi:hypothetical protein